MMTEIGARFPQSLWNRQLPHFPSQRRQMGLLALIVLCTITMYYQQYVAGAVAPSILAHFGFSFRSYITITVGRALLGPFPRCLLVSVIASVGPTSS